MTDARAELRRWFAPIHLVDVFVYVVVLNLAIEYVPVVIAETFTMSLFTAIVLKLVLEAVVAVKDRIKHRFKTAATPLGKVLAGGGLWLLLIGSKFVVLELIALIFGSSVSLGGFWSVTGLILVLLLARTGMHRLLSEGGTEAAAPPDRGERRPGLDGS